MLFIDRRFKGITVGTKVLYGLLLDRMAFFLRNNWLDTQSRAYIIFTVADVMETLGCAEQKANKLLDELGRNTTAIGNIRAYILSAFFNA